MSDLAMPQRKKDHVQYNRRIPSGWVTAMDRCLEGLKGGSVVEVVGRETVPAKPVEKKVCGMPFEEAERCAEAIQEMFPAAPRPVAVRAPLLKAGGKLL